VIYETDIEGLNPICKIIKEKHTNFVLILMYAIRTRVGTSYILCCALIWWYGENWKTISWIVISDQ